MSEIDKENGIQGLINRHLELKQLLAQALTELPNSMPDSELWKKTEALQKIVLDASVLREVEVLKDSIHRSYSLRMKLDNEHASEPDAMKSELEGDFMRVSELRQAISTLRDHLYSQETKELETDLKKLLPKNGKA